MVRMHYNTILWSILTPLDVCMSSLPLKPTLLYYTDDTSGKCKWRVTLPPTQGSTQESYTITANSQKYGSIKISDVLFGDVWVCSGQSNMQFTVSQVCVSHKGILPDIGYIT